MSQALLMVGGARTPGRDDHDFYETPECAVEALLRVEHFVEPIWEPACGKGAIVRALNYHGYRYVHATDLIDRGFGMQRDFLATKDSLWPSIITNPPFKLAAKFAYQACKLTTGKAALLCRLGWLEGVARGQMFAELPLARVWVFSKRLPMMHRDGWDGKRSSSAIAFAWFVFDHSHCGAPVIGWV